MIILVKLPVMVSIDNIGAIFMLANVNATSHSKHVVMKYKYVNKYMEDGIVKIVCIKSAENYSNILTMNLSGDLHERHSEKIIGEKPV